MMSDVKRSDVVERLNETFCNVFNDDSIVITNDMTAADIEGWDSLTNVRLLVQIEQDFNINFSSSEIADIPNVGELADLILSRL